jgi:hypothetical protein
LTGGVVGSVLPGEVIKLACLPDQLPRVEGKRQIEDQIVRRLLTNPASFGMESIINSYLEQIWRVAWYVLSARRADRLLRELLFERAYALRVRAFARNYRGAEVDMHYSLSQDLRPLDEFLRVLRDQGLPGLVGRLERGTL